MTADSAIRLLQESTKSIPGWNGIEYKAAFPMKKPSGANFYPSDLDKMVKFFIFTSGKIVDYCLLIQMRQKIQIFPNKKV